MSLSPLLTELLAAVDLSKIDKQALAQLLAKALDPEQAIEIINRHNDEILDKSLDDTAAQSRRWVGWVDRIGRSTAHKLMDNFIANAIRKHWPKS